jgi:hypothetical protein
MLYKLGQNNNDVFDSLEPVPFQGIQLEKHLEDLLANNLSEKLFEDNKMMPIRQERPYEGVADIYALNEQGDLIIFELKRGGVGGDAVYQALGYCETAAHWDFQQLQNSVNWDAYGYDSAKGLREAHQNHFELQQPLDEATFNTQQKLMIVGSASSDDLIRKVDYWKSKGISVDFIPYRIYEIKAGEKKEYYFEFFSLPYDRHYNPAEAKGVIFDTNRSYNEDSIWYMCEHRRVAAFGDRQEAARCLRPGDTVFLCHKWTGIIAAGTVKGKNIKEDQAEEALFWDLDWLTAFPKQDGGTIKAMSVADVKKVLKRDFYWARIDKRPFLSMDESKQLLDALIGYVGPKA